MVEIQDCAQPSAIAQALRFEVISDKDRFYGMEREWDELVDLAAVPHPFLSHMWLRTWWDAFGDGKQLYVILVRSGDNLVAAAPLMINNVRMYGIRVKRLETLYNYHAPRCDFIIGARQEEVYRIIWNAISEGAQRCDVILLAQVPEDSPTIPRIDDLATRDGWIAGKWKAPPSPYIPLGCEYETFLKTLTGHYRYNLRKRHERLSKIEPVTLERITESSRVRDAMQDGLRIEAAAWKGGEGTAMNSDSRVAEFYTRFAERAAERGLLELTFLKLGEKRIAFDYVLRAKDAYYGVKIGYDPQYHTYSPGNMLLNLILQGACANGASEYDFLGIDDEWKYDWTKETRSHGWLFLFRRGLKARFLQGMKFWLVPWLKKRKQLQRLRKTVLGLRRAIS